MIFNTFLFLVTMLHPPGVIRHGIDKQLSLDLARQPEFECVGMMTQNFRIKGSCVLIHPRMALTAAHTLIKLVEGEPLILEFDSLRIKVDSFRIHPWYTSNKGADLAVLYLSEPIKNIPVAALNTSRKEIGRIGTSVGFGNFSVANNPRDITDAGRVKSAGQNMLDSIEGIRLPDRQVPFLYADFDSPDSPALNRSGTTECLPLEYGLDGGDSGGGMFIQGKKKKLLAGINALQKKNIGDLMRTGTFYGSASEWVRISVFRKWIKRKMKELK
ncbi:MAG: trypsin-like serine protease [Saprospiraceae bacterium]